MSLRAALLCSLLTAVVTARSVTRARTSTPAPAAAPRQPDDWRRYIEDESLTGRNIPCSNAEKECFKLGRVLYPGNGTCYMLGPHEHPCPPGLTFQIDKREALSGSGHFKGVCLNGTMCSVGKVKMADDGSCLTFEELGEICSPRRGYILGQDIFGEYECVRINKSAGPVPVRQPRHPGRCLFPDVRKATFPQYVENLPDSIPCSQDEARCLQNKTVFYERDRLCYELLTQGPCARGQWLVIDKAEAVNGSHRLRAVCTARPCPGRGARLLVEGVCHTHSYMERRVCAGYPMGRNLFGEAGCGPDLARGLPHQSATPGQCQWTVAPTGPLRPFFAVVNLGGAECSTSDTGACSSDVDVLHDEVEYKK